MQKVNAEAKNPRACGIAAIAYIPARWSPAETVGAKLIQVIRVNIVAGYNGSGWQHVTGMVQYAIIEAKGMTI